MSIFVLLETLQAHPLTMAQSWSYLEIVVEKIMQNLNSGLDMATVCLEQPDSKPAGGASGAGGRSLLMKC